MKRSTAQFLLSVLALFATILASCTPTPAPTAVVLPTQTAAPTYTPTEAPAPVKSEADQVLENLKRLLISKDILDSLDLYAINNVFAFGDTLLFLIGPEYAPQKMSYINSDLADPEGIKALFSVNKHWLDAHASKYAISPFAVMAFNSDGTKVAVEVKFHGENNESQTICIFNINETTDPKCMPEFDTTNTFYYYDPAWDNEGDWVYFVNYTYQNTKSFITKWNIQTDEVLGVVEGRHPFVTPNNTLVYYQPDIHVAINLLDLDTNSSKVLKDDAIAYATDKLGNIYTTDKLNCSPCQVIRWDTATGEPKQTGIFLKNLGIGSFIANGDGTRFAYTIYVGEEITSASREITVCGQTGCSVVASGDVEAKTFFESHGGEFLFYMDYDIGHLEVIKVTQ